MNAIFFAHFEIRFIILNIFATAHRGAISFLDMKYIERIQDRPKRPFGQDVQWFTRKLMPETIDEHAAPCSKTPPLPAVRNLGEVGRSG